MEKCETIACWPTGSLTFSQVIPSLGPLWMQEGGQEEREREGEQEGREGREREGDQEGREREGEQEGREEEMGGDEEGGMEGVGQR